MMSGPGTRLRQFQFTQHAPVVHDKEPVLRPIRVMLAATKHADDERRLVGLLLAFDNQRDWLQLHPPQRSEDAAWQRRRWSNIWLRLGTHQFKIDYVEERIVA